MKKIGLLVVVCLLAIFGWYWLRQDKKPASTGVKPATAITSKPAQPTFNKQLHSTSDPASPWVIVNKQHPLNPKNYTPVDLVAVGNGQYMRAEAASNLATMLSEARALGLTLTPASGYRSYDTQVAVYGNEVKTYGQQQADNESARPGFSEHQTGWAMDFGSAGCSITDCFGQTAAGRWLTDNAATYGFILRYTTDNAAVTGYRAESWHFRYVGKSLAKEMQNQKISTLEQFFAVSGGSTYSNQ